MGRARIACMSRVTCTHLQSCRHAREQENEHFHMAKVLIFSFSLPFYSRLRQNKERNICTRANTLYIQVQNFVHNESKINEYRGGKRTRDYGLCDFLNRSNIKPTKHGQKEKNRRVAPVSILVKQNILFTCH